MRPTTQALLHHYLDGLDAAGDVLEIGGHNLRKCAIKEFPAPRFKYHDLNIAESDIPNTIISDITNCSTEIGENSFDVVYTEDVFEHIDRPWLAAKEIARILRPGGLVVATTLWSWRNHPCPIDYWRFSPECLEFLFSGLTCMEKGYDLRVRRRNVAGSWKSGKDSVPLDELGGWREHWSVYFVGTKGRAPELPKFRSTDHPLAKYLRMDTQGQVTNPALLGEAPTPPLDEQVAKLEKELAEARAEAAQMRKDAPVQALIADVRMELAQVKAETARIRVDAAALRRLQSETRLERAARSLERLRSVFRRREG